MTQMAKEVWMAMVREALYWLAAPSEKQIGHLKEMNVWPCADELALELDDVAPLLPEALQRGEISSETELAVRHVSNKLDQMSGQQNSHLWTPDALANSEHWETVRLLASEALGKLERFEH